MIYAREISYLIALGNRKIVVDERKFWEIVKKLRERLGFPRSYSSGALVARVDVGEYIVCVDQKAEWSIRTVLEISAVYAREDSFAVFELYLEENLSDMLKLEVL